MVCVTATAGLLVGVNALGGAPSPREVVGSYRRVVTARGGKRYAIIEVEGRTIDIPEAAVTGHGFVLGDRVPLTLHDGPLYDWGAVHR